MHVRMAAGRVGAPRLSPVGQWVAFASRGAVEAGVRDTGGPDDRNPIIDAV